ncbi:uncharacterized protein LOC119406418 [Rhipicephalus sanguineus]|uniref:uncharacterized protein LOC119406418 n=1 Tax=Rhipicephalus sanguineus TaxID=34632 RepID=UPI001893004E|nr:uncharacterized protein LOC119406418 [Rhipicephalus sanguineus]
MIPHAFLAHALPAQYGQQEGYASPGGGSYSPGGTYAPPQAAMPYMGPLYTPSQPQLASPPMYGPQPYAAVPFAQPAMSPMASYDPAYANYIYGLQSAQRQYLIQSPPRRKGMLSTDNILTVLMVGGTIFLVVFAMLLVVTVVVPRLTRKQHSGHRRRHVFPAEFDYQADAEQLVDAPQMSAVAKDEQTESRLQAAGAEHGSKHGHKDPQKARHVKRRAKA